MTKIAVAKPDAGSITSDNFTHEVTRVGRTLGRDAGIEFVFTGVGAKTNGSTIVMPALPSGSRLTGEQAGAFRGYGDHESFHVRKTDFNAFARAFKASGVKDLDKDTNNFTDYAQAIEDVRIEKFGCEEYPGAKGHIASTVEVMASEAREQLKEDPSLGATLETAGPLAVALEGRLRNGVASAACRETLELMSPEVREYAGKVNDYIDEHFRDGKDGTLDTLNLARVCAKSEDPPATPPPPPPPGEGGDCEEGEPSDTPSEGKDEGEGKDEDGKPEGAGDPKSALDDLEQTLSEEAKIGGGFGGSGAEKLDTELSSVIEKEARNLATTPDDNGLAPYTIADPSQDRFVTRDDSGRFAERLRNGESGYQSSMHRGAGSMSVMRRKLERMVLAKQSRGWEQGLEQGVLNPKRLTQAVMGVPTVYRRREDVPEIDTSVCILIDLSGSMSGEKLALAQDVAIGLSQCLHYIGADFAVYGFGNMGVTKGRDGRSGGEFVRCEPLIMPVFKDFDETLRQSRESLGKISDYCLGNNSDPDGILRAWARLRERRAKRRILITLSDGCPAWYIGASSGPGRVSAEGYTKRAVQTIISEGCEAAGVGIMDSSVASFYPVWTVADSLEEFAGKAMDTLARMMLGGRVRVSGKVAA